MVTGSATSASRHMAPCPFVDRANSSGLRPLRSSSRWWGSGCNDGFKLFVWDAGNAKRRLLLMTESSCIFRCLLSCKREGDGTDWLQYTCLRAPLQAEVSPRDRPELPCWLLPRVLSLRPLVFAFDTRGFRLQHRDQPQPCNIPDRSK
jgi:hypothetical protein